jgi:hypothetical protein
VCVLAANRVCTTMRALLTLWCGFLALGDAVANLAVPGEMPHAHEGVVDANALSALARHSRGDRGRRQSAASNSGLRVYVVTMDGTPGSHRGNRGRLNRMRLAWATSCPNNPVEFVVCPGIGHPIRGHGLTLSFVQCINRAIEDGVKTMRGLRETQRRFAKKPILTISLAAFPLTLCSCLSERGVSIPRTR